MCKDNLELIDEMTISELDECCECDCEECNCDECCGEEESKDDSVEALQELVEQVLEEILKVDIDTKEVQNTPIDKAAFEEGVRIASKWGGAISVYKSLNLDEKTILELVLNQQTGECNLAQQEVINKGQIDLAKQTQL